MSKHVPTSIFTVPAKLWASLSSLQGISITQRTYTRIYISWISREINMQLTDLKIYNYWFSFTKQPAFIFKGNYVFSKYTKEAGPPA